MPVYSHSRLSAYEKCPLQYRYRYLDRIKRDTQSIEAFMGNRVHESLERLYREVMASRLPSLDELVAGYHRSWDENFSGKIKIVRADRTAAAYRAIGQQCIEYYYQTHSPFDHGRTLGLEDRFELELDQAGRYRLQGYIDRLVLAGEEVYEVHDYKTAGKVPWEKDLRADRQLTLYRMAVARRFPKAREIRLIWHYLACQEKRTIDRTPQEIEQHRRHMIDLIDVIEAVTEAAGEFPARKSALCDWCEYRDDLCPEFKREESAPAPRPIRWLDKAVQISLFGPAAPPQSPVPDPAHPGRRGAALPGRVS